MKKCEGNRVPPWWYECYHWYGCNRLSTPHYLPKSRDAGPEPRPDPNFAMHMAPTTRLSLRARVGLGRSHCVQPAGQIWRTIVSNRPGHGLLWLQGGTLRVGRQPTCELPRSLLGAGHLIC